MNIRFSNEYEDYDKSWTPNMMRMNIINGDNKRYGILLESKNLVLTEITDQIELNRKIVPYLIGNSVFFF